MLTKLNKLTVLFLGLICLITVFACRKEISGIFDKTPDNASQWAKDYFTNVLVKNEGNQLQFKNLKGVSLKTLNDKPNMKSPMWVRAKSGKTPRFDFVEVPLMYNRKVSPTIQTKKKEIDKQVIDATFDRLIIYKDKSGKINQRIVTYLPDESYLRRHKGDISHNQINNLDKDFDGYLIYKSWEDRVLFILRIDKGVAKKLKLSPALTSGKKSLGGSSVKDYYGYEGEPGCEDYYYIIWSQWCYYDNPDDPTPSYCDPPVIESEEWLYTICPEEGPIDCADPMNFENAECNPQFEPEPEIINNVTDTCLKKTVDAILNNSVTGKIREIISGLDSNTNVHIKVFDAATTLNGSAGQTTETSWITPPNGTTQFNTNITLSTDLLLGSTKEHATAVLIHEIIHAYFRKNTGKKQEFEGKDHSDIANNYISPMASFLSDFFSISLTDATCLAWNGVADSKAFKEATAFTVGMGSNATTISKEDMGVIATNYALKLNGKGKGVCQ